MPAASSSTTRQCSEWRAPQMPAALLLLPAAGWACSAPWCLKPSTCSRTSTVLVATRLRALGVARYCQRLGCWKLLRSKGHCRPGAGRLPIQKLRQRPATERLRGRRHWSRLHLQSGQLARCNQQQRRRCQAPVGLHAWKLGLIHASDRCFPLAATASTGCRTVRHRSLQPRE